MPSAANITILLALLAAGVLGSSIDSDTRRSARDMQDGDDLSGRSIRPFTGIGNAAGKYRASRMERHRGARDIAVDYDFKHEARDIDDEPYFLDTRAPDVRTARANVRADTQAVRQDRQALSQDRAKGNLAAVRADRRQMASDRNALRQDKARLRHRDFDDDVILQRRGSAKALAQDRKVIAQARAQGNWGAVRADQRILAQDRRAARPRDVDNEINLKKRAPLTAQDRKALDQVLRGGKKHRKRELSSELDDTNNLARRSTSPTQEYMDAQFQAEAQIEKMQSYMSTHTRKRDLSGVQSLEELD